MHNDLSHRLEFVANEKFNYNKIQAIRYLKSQKEMIYKRAIKCKIPHIAKRWWIVKRAYDSAIFRIEYWLQMDQELKNF